LLDTARAGDLSRARKRTTDYAKAAIQHSPDGRAVGLINPEVAGSNPAPATQKGPQTRAFRLLKARPTAFFVPVFVPIAFANRSYFV
jgi:hypothetical protein